VWLYDSDYVRFCLFYDVVSGHSKACLSFHLCEHERGTHVVLRAPPLPTPTRTRRVARPTGLLIALAALGVCVLLSISVGSKAIAPGEVWNALAHYDGGYDHDVVRSLRVPRTILGVFVGAALGL